MNSFPRNLNKYLLAVVVLLLFVTGLQSYLLLQRSDEPDSNRTITQMKEMDLFSENPLMQDWDPFQDFQRMQKRMDSYFEKGFPELESSFPKLKSFSFGGPFAQNSDIETEGGKYVVRIELPGLDQASIDVNVEGQSLKISGNIERKDETKKDQAFVQSYQSQHFERYMTLPGPVKPETLKTEYEGSVLIITLEKSLS